MTNSNSTWRLACLAVALSLGGSIWASVAGVGCADCQAAGTIIRFGPLNLAVLGILCYSALLAAMCLKGPSAWTLRSIFAVAGVHLVLLMVLLRQRLFCPPCLLTALGAFTAAGLVYIQAKERASRAAIALPVVAVLTLAGFVVDQKMAAHHNEGQVRALILSLKQEPEAARESVRLVIYTRPHCPFCAKLKTDILPGALAQVPNVRLEEREAPSGLPAPTLIVLGGAEVWFVGLPPQAALIDALRRARK